MYLYNAIECRRADQLMGADYHTPSLLLMEAAGTRAAAEIGALYPLDRQFLLLCGTGGNGGDGYVVARELHRAGKTVHILQSTGAPSHPDAQVYHRICQALNIPMTVWHPEEMASVEAFLAHETVVVDALLGTGTEGELTGSLPALLSFLRPLARRVVALDLPSGLVAGSGAVYTEPLLARHTLAFGLAKPCHYLTPATDFCGQLNVLDIGFFPAVTQALRPTAELLDADWLQRTYRPRILSGHKGDFGHVLVAGGSHGMAGAPALAAAAALESGAGLVTALVPGSAAPAFHRKLLEGLVQPYGASDQPVLDVESLPLFTEALAGKQAVVVGPGMGQQPTAGAFLDGVLEQVKRMGTHAPALVLDADALNLLAAEPHRFGNLPPHTVVTPHPGEMARLSGRSIPAVQNNRLKAAEALANDHGLVVVLKGRNTLIASPDSPTLICPHGNAGMASAGMGDVLAGAIGAWAAQGYPLVQASAIAVCTHAVAGDRVARRVGQEAVTAEKVLRELGPAWVTLAPQYPPVA